MCGCGCVLILCVCHSVCACVGVCVCVYACAGKVKDRKLGSAVVDLLDAMAACVGPWLLVSRLMGFAQASKVRAPSHTHSHTLSIAFAHAQPLTLSHTHTRIRLIAPMSPVCVCVCVCECGRPPHRTRVSASTCVTASTGLARAGCNWTRVSDLCCRPVAWAAPSPPTKPRRWWRSRHCTDTRDPQCWLWLTSSLPPPTLA